MALSGNPLSVANNSGARRLLTFAAGQYPLTLVLANSCRVQGRGGFFTVHRCANGSGLEHGLWRVAYFSVISSSNKWRLVFFTLGMGHTTFLMAECRRDIEVPVGPTDEQKTELHIFVCIVRI